MKPTPRSNRSLKWDLGGTSVARSRLVSACKQNGNGTCGTCGTFFRPRAREYFFVFPEFVLREGTK